LSDGLHLFLLLATAATSAAHAEKIKDITKARSLSSTLTDSFFAVLVVGLALLGIA
jgi:hypothetical protein